MDNEKIYQTLDLISQKSKLETEDINTLLKLSQSDNIGIKKNKANWVEQSGYFNDWQYDIWI